MTAPRVCGECVEFIDPPRIDSPKTDAYSCSPRGTRWRLLRKPDQNACRTIHARKPDDGRPDQGALL